MKGIIYSWLYTKKALHIASLAIFAAACMIVVLMGRLITPDNVVLYSFAETLFVLLPILVIAMPAESNARHLEDILKNRFSDYCLASALTPAKFTASILIKSLISCAVSFIMGIVVLTLAALAKGEPLTSDILTVTCIYTSVAYIVDWSLTPLVIYFKSSDKAGLVFGLVFGFGVVFPTLVLTKNLDGDAAAAFVEKILSSNWLAFAAVGLTAAVYAVVYFIVLSRVKRGDIC